MSETEDLRASGGRIEELLDQLASLDDERAGMWGEELVRCLASLYGSAIERVLAMAASPDAPRGAQLVERLAEDDLVASVLLVHDLHPLDAKQRIEHALVSLTTAMPTADVRLLSLDESSGTAKLRVVVADRPGQPASAAAQVAESKLRDLVERVAPEIEKIEVDRLLPGTPVKLTRGEGRSAPVGHARTAPEQPAPRISAGQGDACEMCSVPLAPEHRHVVDLEGRSLVCTCQACTMLFERDGSVGGRFRAVPRDVYELGDLRLTQAEWDLLQIPVGVAFFMRDSASGEASAFYPGPAGATESLLALGTYDELVNEHPMLAGVEPDVEALLVRIVRGESECFVAPIDLCYELTGILRQSWRGFDGGREAHERIDAFFERLARQSRPYRSKVGAIGG